MKYEICNKRFTGFPLSGQVFKFLWNIIILCIFIRISKIKKKKKFVTKNKNSNHYIGYRIQFLFQAMLAVVT